MNAPTGQLADRAHADEGVRLTIDFDELEPGTPEGEAPPAAAGDPWAQPTDRPRAGGAAPPPAAARVPPQLAAIELTLSVEVGSLSIPLRDLMAVEPGQLLALDRLSSEPVSVLVNGKPFATGEIVAIGDRFGVRLIDILAPAEGGI